MHVDTKFMTRIGCAVLLLIAASAIARAQFSGVGEPEMVAVEVSGLLDSDESSPLAEPLDDNLCEKCRNGTHKPQVSRSFTTHNAIVETANVYAAGAEMVDEGHVVLENKGRRTQRVLNYVNNQDHHGNTRKADPIDAENTAAIRDTMNKLREAKEDTVREAAAVELKNLLETAFDRDYDRRSKELDQLEKRVERLRTQLNRRKAARDDMIDVRVKSLLYEAEGIGFPDGLDVSGNRRRSYPQSSAAMSINPRSPSRVRQQPKRSGSKQTPVQLNNIFE